EKSRDGNRVNDAGLHLHPLERGLFYPQADFHPFENLGVVTRRLIIRFRRPVYHIRIEPLSHLRAFGREVEGIRKLLEALTKPSRLALVFLDTASSLFWRFA